MNYVIKALGIWLCVLVLWTGMQVNAAQELSIYEDGDVVGVIGDSITHARYCDISYVDVLNQYYLCRFPDRKVEFRNLGVAGGKTCDILTIYDLDPSFQGINKAVIMLGTNEAILDYTSERYISDMNALIERLKSAGLDGEDILILSPPICDEKVASSSLYKFEDTVLEYILKLETKVPEWGVQYLNIHSPMVELTNRMQEENPKNTLTTDAIHPTETGQMLIAYYILHAQGIENEILSVIPAETENEDIILHRTEKGMYWTDLQETLPLATTEELTNFLEFYEPASALYREILKIKDFSENTVYQVLMDETELGRFTGRELAAGINIAALEIHPLQATSQQLEALNRQWHKSAVKYRDIWIDVIMQRVTYTKKQAQAKYDNWRKKDEALREEMYGLVQGAIGNSYRFVIVEEGYSAKQLEQDWLEQEERAQEQAMKEAQELARKEAEEQALKEAEELAQKETEEQAARKARDLAQRKKILQTAMGIVIVAVGVTTCVMLIKRNKNRNYQSVNNC